MLKYLAELMPNCQTLKRCFVLFFATSYNALENDSRKKSLITLTQVNLLSPVAGLHVALTANKDEEKR